MFRRLLLVTACVLVFAWGVVAAQTAQRTYLPIVHNDPTPQPTPRPGEPTWTRTPRPTSTLRPTTTPLPTATATATNTATATATRTPTVTNTRNPCDPSYPDVCIPSPPPDLNCTDIEYRNFRVILDDPHRFDIDFDGIGCEDPSVPTATATATPTP